MSDVPKPKAKLESIFDSTENMIMFTMDSADRVNAFNKNFKNIFEYDFGLTFEPSKSFIEHISRVVDEDPPRAASVVLAGDGGQAAAV